jgi:hypothetical protein
MGSAVHSATTFDHSLGQSLQACHVAPPLVRRDNAVAGTDLHHSCPYSAAL